MSIKDWLDSITALITGTLVPVVYTLAAFMFIWGVVKYFILSTGDPAEHAKGRSFIIWGLLGLVVMFSIWALVKIILSTFGIQ